MSKARQLADLGNVYDDGALSHRNMVVNGGMTVAQRGISTSITSAGTYFSPDRFEAGITGTDQLAATLSQSTTSPDGFANSLKFEVTTAETTLDADEIVTIRQKFEGQDLQRIAKGTSSAEQVTASFWVRSSNTGTYILELYDPDNTRQVSKSYTINAANTWEYKTITFPADVTGAFDNDNNLSLFFMFWLAAGSNYTSGTLNTSWASATTANRVVGQTNLIASTNDFYLTAVQLEIGDTATPFEHRSYGDELARCQRYYYQRGGAIQGGNGYEYLAHGYGDTTTRAIHLVEFPVQMRVPPTFRSSQTASEFYWRAPIGNPTSPVASSVPTGGGANVLSGRFDCNTSNSFVVGDSLFFGQNNSTDTFIAFDAEL
jgi:hypothetical protein